MGAAWEGFGSSCVQKLVQIKSEAGEIAKGCVLVRRWRGDGRLKTKGGAQYSLAEAVVSSNRRKSSLLVDMREEIPVYLS